MVTVHRLSKTTLLLTASVLILVGFALLVIGLASEAWIWRLGLAVLGTAMLISFATRFVREGEAEPRSTPTR